jgi:D-alanine transaminase
MIVYFNNQLLELSKVQISSFDRGFLFADGVYETMRTYNGELFKIDEHLKRLKKSLNEIQIKYEGITGLEKIIYQLAEVNNLTGKDFLVYIQITRGVSYPRKHSFPSPDEQPTIFISVSKLDENTADQQNGVKIILLEDLRWLRCDIKSVSLLPAVLANQKAIESNAVEAVLHRNDLITEGSHTNFFGIINGKVVTAPKSNLILAGITRDIVVDMCKKLKIKLEEEFIKLNELKNYQEFFITSTTKEVYPVVQIDDRVIGSGKPGVITIKLQAAFKELTAVS